MKISIGTQGFRGEMPGVDPTLLPENNATVARNCRLLTGAIMPLRAPLDYGVVQKSGTQQSIYRYNAVAGDMNSGSIFTWPEVVDMVRGPVRENTQELSYFTGDAYPKLTDSSLATTGSVWPGGAYRLGVPAPASVPTVTVEGAASDDAADVRSRDYVVTYLAQLGSLVMEGAPSLATAIVDVSGAQTVKLTNLPLVPTGNYNITGLRLYRRVTSGQNQNFLRVTDLPIGTSEWTDSVPDASIPGDLLVSQLWDVPPADLHSLGALANGFLFGASGSDICVSEAFRPHAWNPFARVPLGERIVGTGQFNGAIVAITGRNPYVISGTNPAALSAQEVFISQGGVSKRSIVSGQFGCVYASPDGLVLLSGQGSGVFTDQLMTRDQWQALNPSTLLGAVHEEQYVGFYNNGTPQGFIFDPDNRERGFIFTDQAVDAAYRDGLGDSLWVVQGDQVRLWDQGTPLTYRWRSRPFVFTAQVTMTAGRVLADEYSDLTYRLIVDDVVRHEQAVTSAQPFRMPSGYGGRVVQVEVEGMGVVRQLEAAESVSELT